MTFFIFVTVRARLCTRWLIAPALFDPHITKVMEHVHLNMVVWLSFSFFCSPLAILCTFRFSLWKPENYIDCLMMMNKCHPISSIDWITHIICHYLQNMSVWDIPNALSSPLLFSISILFVEIIFCHGRKLQKHDLIYGSFENG